MQKYIVVAASLSMLATLGGCKTMGTGETIGTAAGGVLGGVIGANASGKNKAVWTALGVAAGAYVGNQLGKYLDEKDKENVAGATVTAAETGEPQSWSNEDNGTSGTTKIVSAEPANTDGDCREIEQTVTLADGSTKADTVKACKGPDGWVVV